MFSSELIKKVQSKSTSATNVVDVTVHTISPLMKKEGKTAVHHKNMYMVNMTVPTDDGQTARITKPIFGNTIKNFHEIAKDTKARMTYVEDDEYDFKVYDLVLQKDDVKALLKDIMDM